jgi:hypothetical protein
MFLRFGITGADGYLPPPFPPFSEGSNTAKNAYMNRVPGRVSGSSR